MTYETLRHFADSYALAGLALIYLALCGWAFRPGAKQRNRAAASLIFEEDDNG